MAWRKSPPELVQLFSAAIPDDPRVERKPMFSYPAAFLNGHLFAGLHQESFILRLSETDRAAIARQHGAEIFQPMPGRSMLEYVALPEAVLADRKRLAAWIAKSMDFVGALPAKAKKPPKPKAARKKA